MANGSFSTPKTYQLFVPEIKRLLSLKKLAELEKFLNALSAFDITDAWKEFTPDEKTILFNLLKTSLSVKVFETLDMPDQKHILSTLSDDVTQAFLQDVPADDLARVFHKLPNRVVKHLFSYIKKAEMVRYVNEMLSFPEHTAGSLMDPKFFTLKKDLTAHQAITALSAAVHTTTDEPLVDIYVADGDGRLLGQVALADLFRASSNMKISEIMTSTQRIQVPAILDQEKVAEHFRKFDLLSCPVVDPEGKLLGIIPASRILDVVREEATEDVQKIGGMEALDAPYFQIGFFSMVKKRAGWLLVLFVGETFTASAMGFFQAELEKALVLALFIPLIISSGGNSGSQATTLVIRAMALGEVRLRDWWKVMRREIASGLTLGGILGCFGLLRILLWPARTTLYGEHYVLIGFTVAASLVGIVLWGTLAGSMLPLILRRLGFDPAAASAPFVATLVDVTGLVIYFTAASLILSGSLL
jgi:magnesium transporter